MQKEKIQKNKACPSKLEHSGGFVILFAVMLSSIILAITIGVLNISYKEIKFSTSAKDTNDAFFAADVGAECALFYDKAGGNVFIENSTETGVFCNGDTSFMEINYPIWKFTVSKLGNEEQGCVVVTVDKSSPSATKIISKGYNDGGSIPNSCTSGENTVERQLELTY